MRRSRIPILALTLGLVALAAAPAAGFQETKNTGTTGLYTVTDNPGAVCLYENNPGQNDDELDRIKVKQVWTHGPFAQKSWVGFRFVIQANRPPFSDGVFKKVYKSPTRKARANDAEVANFTGLYVTNENTKSRFRVKLVFTYYAQGSKTNQIGKVAGFVEVYKHKLNKNNQFNTGSEGDPGTCARKYQHPS